MMEEQLIEKIDKTKDIKKNLQNHYEEFVQNTNKSNLNSIMDTGVLEKVISPVEFDEINLKLKSE